MQCLLQVAGAACFFLAAANSSRADVIVFDPNGFGGVAPLSIGYFHLDAANNLARGVLPFTVGNTFQLLFHAQMNSVVVLSDTAVFPFEVTIVGSVTEKVTTVNNSSPSRVTFQLSKTQTSDSFVEVYSDSAVNADPLTGTGYNDGTLILRGTPVSTLPNVGTFCLTDPQPTPEPSFDLFAANDYAGVTSVVGAGATKLNVVVGFFDPEFFRAPKAGDPGRQVQIGDVMTIDVSHAAPFNGVDPSRAFVASPNPGTGTGPSPTANPSIGAVNGSSGPDLQTQGTVGFSISAPTPTPSGTPGTTPTPIPGVPKIIVSASRTQLREGADSTITFSSNIATSADLTVNYSVGGSATLNVDYTLTGNLGTVVIPANQTSASIVLHSIADTVKEPQGEPATLTIEPGSGYQVSTNKNANRAVVLILDRKS